MFPFHLSGGSSWVAHSSWSSCCHSLGFHVEVQVENALLQLADTVLALCSLVFGHTQMSVILKEPEGGNHAITLTAVAEKLKLTIGMQRERGREERGESSDAHQCLYVWLTLFNSFLSWELLLPPFVYHPIPIQCLGRRSLKHLLESIESGELVFTDEKQSASIHVTVIINDRKYTVSNEANVHKVIGATKKIQVRSILVLLLSLYFLLAVPIHLSTFSFFTLPPSPTLTQSHSHTHTHKLSLSLSLSSLLSSLSFTSHMQSHTHVHTHHTLTYWSSRT